MHKDISASTIDNTAQHLPKTFDPDLLLIWPAQIFSSELLLRISIRESQTSPKYPGLNFSTDITPQQTPRSTIVTF